MKFFYDCTALSISAADPLPELELLCRHPACWYLAAASQVIGRGTQSEMLLLDNMRQAVQGDLWCIVGHSCGIGCKWEGLDCRGIMGVNSVGDFRGRKKQKFFRLLHDNVAMMKLEKKNSSIQQIHFKCHFRQGCP